MQIIQVSAHIIKTVEIEEYYRLFNRYLCLYDSHKKAWEIIESEREAVGIPARYNSYETFKSAKYQYYKRRDAKKIKENPMQIRLF